MRGSSCYRRSLVLCGRERLRRSPPPLVGRVGDALRQRCAHYSTPSGYAQPIHGHGRDAPCDVSPSPAPPPFSGGSLGSTSLGGGGEAEAAFASLVSREILTGGSSEATLTAEARAVQGSVSYPFLQEAPREPTRSAPCSSSGETPKRTESVSGALWTATRVDELLARHASLRFSFSASHAAGAFSREERVEVRELVDYVTQTLHEHHQQHVQLSHRQRQWVGQTCRLAFHAGLYTRCCELFFLSLEKRQAAGPVADVNPPAGLEPKAPAVAAADSLPEYVVEAAVAARELLFLERCFAFAVSTHASLCPEGGTWTASTGVMQGLRVYGGCVRLCSLSGDGVSSSASLHTAGVRKLGCRIAAWLRLPAKDHDKGAEEYFAASVRLAKYSSKGHLHWEGSQYSPEEADARVQSAIHLQAFRRWCTTQGRASQWLTASCLTTALRSAVQAQRWDIASFYVWYVDLYLHDRPRSSPPAAVVVHVEDPLVATVLRYYLFSRQPQRGVAWLARVREAFPAYLPSVSTGSVVARVVGAAGGSNGGRALSLALWCLEGFLHRSQPAPPTPQELFDGVCALARCGLPNFAAIVDSLVENDLLVLSAERRLHLRLLHCRGSVRWRSLLESLLSEALTRAGDSASPASAASHPFSLEAPGATADPAQLRRYFSPRNAYVTLLVMQEGEHPLFLTYYRLFLLHVAASAVERAQWASFAVVWATARAGRLPSEDMLFVAREVGQLLLLSGPYGGGKEGTVAAIPAAVRRSLEAKWAIFYAQFSPAWWERHTAAPRQHCPDKQQQPWQKTGAGRPSPPVVVAPSAASRAPFPVARFLKRRAVVSLSCAPAELYAVTTTRMVAARRRSNDSVDDTANRDAWRHLCATSSPHV